MPCTDCNDTNIPEVDETAMECCEITSTDCVHTAEANECFAYGKGVTLTYALKRICDYFKKILERLNNLESNDCFCPETVVYREERALTLQEVAEPIDNTYYPLIQTQYTVPAGGGGLYEIKWLARVNLTPSIQPLNTSARYDLFINGVEHNSGLYQEAGISTTGDVMEAMQQSLEVYRYNVSLSPGDVVEIRQETQVYQTSLADHSIYKITKIG